MATDAARLDAPVDLPVGDADVLRFSARGLRKTFRRATGPVLDGVDLAVRPGTLVGIVGVNGAGKTTLLRIAAGLIDPDAGTVELDGLTPRGTRREYQRRLGFLSAGQTGLYARLSVRAHLELWARLALVPRELRDGAIETAIAQFALGELAGRRVDRISTGQRQRTRLAMTFLHEPRLVLLDEPLASLDEEGAELLTARLASLTAGGGSAVYCAPTGERMDEADERYELRAGKLVRT